MTTSKRYESDFGGASKAAENLDFDHVSLAQSGAQQCARQEKDVRSAESPLELGVPMTIGEVASLLGCSVWTVRQRYLPIGLPYFRIGSTGKLMFYRNQIVRWILEKQRQKEGEIR